MTRINGILHLYHHYLRTDAPTLIEHITSFERLSAFPVYTVNVELGFPKGLNELEFSVIMLHYSSFGDYPFKMTEEFQQYIERQSGSYKVIFFQDEYQFCPQRFALINRLKIDCIFTLVELAYMPKVYGKYTGVKTIRHTLTGFVGEPMLEKARAMAKPDAERTIDIGYRARKLPFRMGKGAQEKHEIAEKFEAAAAGHGLTLDIKPGSHRRLHGDNWYRFVADCKGFLGVEAGVSVFDLEDEVRQKSEQMLLENPRITFEEMSGRLLAKWEEQVPYRTISPRHFEAAAFRVCQILYEGHYNGILQPDVHYLSLKKDFSNFEHVIRRFRDPAVRKTMTDRAYNDLIASGKYTYEAFIKGVDATLNEAGLTPVRSPEEARAVATALRKGWALRAFRIAFLSILYMHFPGRAYVFSFLKNFRKFIRTLLTGKKSVSYSSQQPS